MNNDFLPIIKTDSIPPRPEVETRCYTYCNLAEVTNCCSSLPNSQVVFVVSEACRHCSMRCQSLCCVNTLFLCYGKYVKETVIDLEMACVVTRTWKMWSYTRRRNLFSCCSPTPFHLCLQLGTQRQKLKGVEFCLIFFVLHIYLFSPFSKCYKGFLWKEVEGTEDIEILLGDMSVRWILVSSGNWA